LRFIFRKEHFLAEILAFGVEREAEHVILVFYLFKVETFKEDNICTQSS